MAAGDASDPFGGQRGVARPQFFRERLRAQPAEIATRQPRLGRPAGLQRRKGPTELAYRLLGKAPVGGQLAPVHRKDGRVILRPVELQQIVARYPGRVLGAVVVERAHTGVGPDDIALRERLGQEAVHRPAQILHLLLRDGNAAGITWSATSVVPISANSPSNGTTKTTRPSSFGSRRARPAGSARRTTIWLPLTRRAATCGSHRRALAQEALHPWTGGVHDGASADFQVPGVVRSQPSRPAIPPRNCPDAARTRHHDCAAQCRIHGVGDHQARIVGPAVVIAEAGSALWLKDLALWSAG